MMHRPQRAVTVLLALMLLLLPVVGALQFHLLDRASEAEAARLQRMAGNAARQIRVEIAYELSSLLALISAWSADARPVEDLSDTLRNWSLRARFPGLVEQVVLALPESGDGRGIEYRATDSDMELVHAGQPAWLRVEDRADVADERQALTAADPMVLRVPAFRAVRADGTVRLVFGPQSDGPLASFVRLDGVYLTQEVLPVLVREHLGTDRHGFQAALVDLTTRELLYASASAAFDDFEGLTPHMSEARPRVVPSEVVPLLAFPLGEATQFGAHEVTAQSPIVQQWMMLRSLGSRAVYGGVYGVFGRDGARTDPRGTVWDRDAAPISGLSLLIWHPAGSIERAAATVRNRNFAISSLILAAFAGAAILFHALYLRAQQQREREQEFVASVTHELRTPVAAMHAVAQNLAEGIVTREDRVREYGAALLDEGRRLRTMIDQTLLYAGLHGGGRGSTQLLDLEQLTQRVTAASPGTSPGQLEVEVEPGLPLYRGDENALSSILTNLLTNGVKHNPSGTRIRLRISCETRTHREWLVVVVADDGTGIPRSELRHVREAFYRGSATSERQTPGTGLGLSIVEHLVAARRGRLVIESGRNNGTCVTVRLPYER